MNFKKDLFKVFSSNLINLIISIVTGFLVPAFLSLDDYAYLKTFTLYITYVGILHFGYLDGLYLKYGGKHESELDKGRLKGEHKFLVLFQLTVTLLSAIIGFLLDDMMLIAFSIAILPINTQTLFKLLYQALGDFNIYSKIMIISPNLLLIFNLLIIFVFKISHYWPFVIANIVAYYVVFIGLEIFFLRKYRGIKAEIDLNEIWSHFKIGIFIMVGNFSAMLFYASDRWFVKFSLPLQDFAFYSFAISMIAVINILINSVTMTFYPYLARGQDEEKISAIKKYLLIIGAFSTSGYFAFEFVIHYFLEKYVPALDILLVLFAAYPAMIVINALYINLYKVNKQQKRYLNTVILMCVVSILLNIGAILTFKNTTTIALTTTAAFYIWYIYSSKHFKGLKVYFKEFLYLALYLLALYFSNYLFNWFFGFVVYLVVLIGLSLLMYKKDVQYLIRDVLMKKVSARAPK